MMPTPDEQATIDAFADLTAALTALNTIITALEAGGPAFDNATPAQRTGAILRMARALRGIALLLNGISAPLGTTRVPR